VKAKVKVKTSRCLINQAPRQEYVWASGGIAPPFLTLALEPPVPIRQEAGWAPEPVLMLWNIQIIFVPAGNRTQQQHVARPTELSQLLIS
jgi:hypothetical protein